MGTQDRSPRLASIIGPPAAIVAAALVLHLLPREVLAFLTAWILISLPVGVLIGHCVLSED